MSACAASNHRFLDLRIRVPEGFESFEPSIRQLVRDTLRRGHVEITFHAEATGATAVEVHHETAARHTCELWSNCVASLASRPQPDLLGLLRLPGVVTGHGAAPASALDDEHVEKLRANIVCVEDALARLEEMRELEGRTLAAEMLVLADEIADTSGGTGRQLSNEAAPCTPRASQPPGGTARRARNWTPSELRGSRRKRLCWPIARM